MYRVFEWTIVTTVIICASGPVFLRPKTRPKYLNGVPFANYNIYALSPKARAFSKQAVDKLTAKKNAKENELIEGKLFQWNISKLAIHQCNISEFAAYVDRFGRWTVSVRGEQNFAMKDKEGSNAPFLPGKGQYNDYLLRNSFYVTIRLYGAFDVEPKQSDQTNGKPAFIEVRLQPFWVERASSRFVLQQGRHSQISRYFHQLTRAEIEFYYR